MKIQDVVDGLAAANAVAGQVQPLIPIVEFGLKQLFALFKKDNPNATEEDFVEHLRTQGIAVQGFSSDWLTAHGYVQIGGVWTKPEAPETPAQPPDPGV